MKHPTPDYPIAAFGEALRSLTGAGMAMFVVCALGGAVPTVAGWRYLPGTEDWVFLTIEYEYERMRPIAASGGLILVVVSAVLWVSRSTTRSSSSRH